MTNTCGTGCCVRYGPLIGNRLPASHADPDPHRTQIMTDKTWLNANEAARFLGYVDRHGEPQARQFRERIALLPGFPDPLRIGGAGHPRWRQDELAEWAERERQRANGRVTA